MFDKDGGGTISLAEIRLIMDQRGERISDAQLAELMAAIDEDRSGEIDFNEFCKMMAVVQTKLSPAEELQAAFNHFDVKGKGKVSKDDVMQVMKELGQNLTPQDISDIMEVLASALLAPSLLCVSSPFISLILLDFRVLSSNVSTRGQPDYGMCVFALPSLPFFLIPQSHT